jgi:hypothetical protein
MISHPSPKSTTPLRSVRALTLAVAAATLALSLPRIAAPATPEAEAQTAARAWLGLVDAGSYPQSWSAAAPPFRASIPQAQWVSRISAVRGPLGAVKSRDLSSAKFARSLPGAPDGEYVVLEFRTSFEHKAEATEMVTPMKDSDGHWRVSGYYIR